MCEAGSVGCGSVLDGRKKAAGRKPGRPLRGCCFFVPPAEVAGVAEHAKTATFDVGGAFWGDRGERTTFDVMPPYEFGAGH